MTSSPANTNPRNKARNSPYIANPVWGGMPWAHSDLVGRYDFMELDERWQPTKYVMRNDRLHASRDRREVAVGSRLIADLTAQFYQAAIGQYARGRLLDLGCGKAPLYGTYAPHVQEAIRVDWGEGLHGQHNVDLVHNLNQPLPFDDDRFDTIIFSDVLEHLPEPEKCWSDLTRVLSPGGSIILNVPFFYRLHEEPYDFYRYTQHALRRFAFNAGLEIDTLKPLGGAPDVMVDMLAKLFSYTPVGNSIAAGIQGFWLLLRRTSLGQTFASKTAKTFPLSYAMVVRKPAKA